VSMTTAARLERIRHTLTLLCLPALLNLLG
jgi:hypothetical protein